MGKKINLEASDDPCMFHFFNNLCTKQKKMSFIVMVDMFVWIVQE